MKASAILALLTYALMGIDGSTVLCFGLDGHVAYESTLVDHHPPGVARVIETGDFSLVRTQPKSAHGPCVDPIMMSAQWKAPKEGDFFTSPIAPAASPIVGSADARNAISWHSGRNGLVVTGASSAPVVDARRTTVLRI